METGFTVTAFICVVLNLTLEEEIEETDEKLVVPEESVVTTKHTPHNTQSFDSSSRVPSGHEKQV